MSSDVFHVFSEVIPFPGDELTTGCALLLLLACIKYEIFMEMPTLQGSSHWNDALEQKSPTTIQEILKEVAQFMFLTQAEERTLDVFISLTPNIPQSFLLSQ